MKIYSLMNKYIFDFLRILNQKAKLLNSSLVIYYSFISKETKENFLRKTDIRRRCCKIPITYFIHNTNMYTYN